MLGKTGNIIIELEDCFTINPGIDFITEGEKQLINRIVNLGYWYQKIRVYTEEDEKMFKNLITKFELSTFDPSEQNIQESVLGNSSYVKAVCDGIKTILNNYYEDILQIESSYLKDKVITIASLSVQLSKYFYILPELSQFLERIEESGMKGGQLLDFIHQCTINGNNEIRQIYEILQRECYHVLYTQLTLWIMHGKLFDYFEEFFVYKIKNKDSSIAKTDKNMMDIENKSNPIVQKQRVKYEESWDSMYAIRYSMLPKNLITMKTAEKILFMGKAVRVLLQRKTDLSSKRIFSDEILAVIKEASEFQFLQFQAMAERVRVHMAEKFLKLIILNEDIENHLLNLRNYYLLGKGEFYQIFIEECGPLFKNRPTKFSEHDVNSRAFQNTIIRLNILENPHIKKIRFTLQSNGFDFPTFSSLIGLSIFGNVHQKTETLRFLASKNTNFLSSVWHN
jgi:gamma-tubulin complex component 4